MKKKTVAILLACVLLMGGVIGGTIAWLTATTDPVTNTFTVGDVKIELDESKLNADGTLDMETRVQMNAYTYVPGDTLNKDPKVTVTEGSEDCWVFVVVSETDESDILNWSIDNTAWTQLTGYTNVYYAAAEETKELNIIAGKQVTVAETATSNSEEPKLVFNAAAVQKDHIETATEAWGTLINTDIYGLAVTSTSAN